MVDKIRFMKELIDKKKRVYVALQLPFMKSSIYIYVMYFIY